MGGAIGAGLTLSADRLTATVTGSDGKIAESFYKLEEGLLVRDVVIEPVSTMEEPVTVVQVSDPHFNYCNEEDLAENNPSTMSTWNNRDLNSFKRMPERAHKALQNLIDGMEYASAYGDATVVTGDVLDYLSWGNLELMKRFITTSYPDTLVTLGNHEPVRVMGLPTDVADQSTTTDSLKNLNFAVEDGSAGQEAAEELGVNYTPVQQQSDALMEVASGTCDAAIIDSLMAAVMVGEGTGYANLTYTLELTSEEYGVGFRKGSDLAEELNKFFEQSYADGTMQQIAEKYGVQAALIEQ